METNYVFDRGQDFGSRPLYLGRFRYTAAINRKSSNFQTILFEAPLDVTRPYRNYFTDYCKDKAIQQFKKFDDMRLAVFRTILACDKQTDRRNCYNYLQYISRVAFINELNECECTIKTETQTVTTMHQGFHSKKNFPIHNGK